MDAVGHGVVSDTIEFAGFRLDRREGAFRRDASGEPIPIAIGSRALELLWTLASRPGHLVTKRELMDAVWPDTAVEEKNLAVQISTLRQVLEREGGKGTWIQTVPSRGYRFAAPPAQAQGAVQEESGDVPSGPARRRNWAVAGAFGAMVVFLAATGLALSDGRLGAQPAPPLAYSPQDRRQSIIVLPFENASGNPAQDDAATSVTREVTALFDRGQSVPSVPAATAAAYRGKTIDVRRIGREHDVHFALLGNAYQQDGRLIVSATLYETAHGNQIWGQGFALADGLEAAAGTVASLIHQHVDQATMDEEVRIAQRHHPGELDKRDLMFAAHASDTLQQLSKLGIQAQIALIDRALALDPNYVWALRAKGRRHADLVLHGFSDNPARDIATATEAVDRALQLAPNNYSTLKEKTYVLRAQGDWPEAEALTRKLLALRPNVSARHSNLGSILMAQGRNAEALDALLSAKRLQIATDDVAVVDANIAATLLATGRLDEAIDQARLAIPQFTPANGRIAEVPWLVLIAAEAASGRPAAARSELNRFLAVPRTLGTVAAVRDVPFLSKNSVLLDGLREAVMPSG